MITCPVKYKISKEFLIKEYINNKKSMKIIAKIVGCSYPVIRKNLSVHHIDYNKQNCNENNLITLCLKCHLKTNIDRNFWSKYFNIFKEIILCLK